MMRASKDFRVLYDRTKALFDEALEEFCALPSPKVPRRLADSMFYSLRAGGKRLRPVLCIKAAEIFGLEPTRAMPLALALEMIHTYSLIHDDLPAMDNDSLRRGRPTCHIVYGEGMAVLAGDFLLNRAYEILLASITPGQSQAVLAARLIAEAAGSSGMIGGQSIDITVADKDLDLDLLKKLHQKKTGALLKAPLDAAACLADAKEEVQSALARYGADLGLAFQIRDDILDVTADSHVLGKTAGKDEKAGKLTYVTALGLDKASYLLDQATGRAEEALKSIQEEYDISFLQELARQLEIRHY
jgi:geranylgeranyl diphosphate synthase type II